MLNYNFAQEFSKIPGPRWKRLGDFSGEQFREEVLEKWFQQDVEVEIDVNDTVLSFSPSFLSEAFGQIAAKYSLEKFNTIIHFKNDTEKNQIFAENVIMHVNRAIEKLK